MTIGENLTTFGGLPVVTVASDATEFPAQSGPVAWRYAADHDDSASAEASLYAWLQRVPDKESVTALLVGPWPQAYQQVAPIGELAAAAEFLTGLRHLFLGEMTFEENEISWINHGDMFEFLGAWQEQLETLRIRGSKGLVMDPIISSTLTELAFESGGLPGGIVEALGRSTLPALRDLELWLGSKWYGATVTAEQLALLLAGTATPALERLGLMDSDDPLRDVTALAGSPLLGRIRVLDLSKGVLGDECVPLLTGGAFAHLQRLVIDHHFLSAEGRSRLVEGLAGVRVELSDEQEADASEFPDAAEDFPGLASLPEAPEPVEPYAGRWVAVGE